MDARPKRPRSGRPHAEILGPVEADTGVRGAHRDVRELLLYLGRPNRREPLVDTLRSQASELDTQFTLSKSIVVDAVLEW